MTMRFFWRAHLERGERRGRSSDIGDNVDMVGVVPLERLGGGEIGLVLVIGEEELDRRTEHLPADRDK